MQLVQPGEELFVVTSKGYGKRTAVEEYKIQARGGKGLLTYDKSKFKKTGHLIGAIVAGDEDEVMLINSKGTIIRIAAREISRLGRATQGVKIMRVGDDIEIISMSKVINEEERAQMAEQAQKQRKKKKAEKRAAEAKAEKEKAKAEKKKAEAAADDGTEQTTFDI